MISLSISVGEKGSTGLSCNILVAVPALVRVAQSGSSEVEPTVGGRGQNKQKMSLWDIKDRRTYLSA